MKPKILGIDDHIQACLAEAHPKVSRYSQPLFAADEFGKPDLFATCVFIEIENIYYLVTAAHAIHEIESTGSPIYVGSTFINEIPSGGYIRSSEKGNDPLDIAAIPLGKEFIESGHIAVLPAIPGGC